DCRLAGVQPRRGESAFNPIGHQHADKETGKPGGSAAVRTPGKAMAPDKPGGSLVELRAPATRSERRSVAGDAGDAAEGKDADRRRGRSYGVGNSGCRLSI